MFPVLVDLCSGESDKGILTISTACTSPLVVLLLPLKSVYPDISLTSCMRILCEEESALEIPPSAQCVLFSEADESSDAFMMSATISESSRQFVCR